MLSRSSLLVFLLFASEDKAFTNNKRSVFLSRWYLLSFTFFPKLPLMFFQFKLYDALNLVNLLSFHPYSLRWCIFWVIPLFHTRTSVSVIQSCTTVRPREVQPTMLLCPWDFPGKNTGVGCRFLLQGIFLTQGLNLGLLHCRRILYCLSHLGSPKNHS